MPKVLTRSADVLGAELFLDAAAFVGLAVKPVEGGGDALIARGARQQIAGELPGQELIVGKVAVEGADHPVAIRRHVAIDVRLVAVGIGVARQVEPVHGHALAIRRRRQVAIDDALEGRRRGVGEERVDLGEGRRQAGQRQRRAANERLARGLGCGTKSRVGEPPGDERSIGFVLDAPAGRFGSGSDRTGRNAQ